MGPYPFGSHCGCLRCVLQVLKKEKKKLEEGPSAKLPHSRPGSLGLRSQPDASGHHTPRTQRPEAGDSV